MRRPSGNTATPRTYNEDTSSQKYYKKRTPQRTQRECPFSVATHLPVATSHTLSGVVSCDPQRTRCPSGNKARLWTYDEDTSSEKSYKKRTPQRTPCEYPFTVATHLPVATSHTFSAPG